MTSRRADRRGGLAALTLVVALASACGGGTTPAVSPGISAGATTPPPAATATASVTASSAEAQGDPTQRPEGDWTLATWTIKRSDSTVAQPIAGTSLVTMEPSCPSGPCDLVLRTVGSSSTSGDSGPAPTTAAAQPTKPMQFRWDGKSYVASVAPHEVSCTPKTGVTVAKGYTTRKTLKLNFVAPSGVAPARVHGTITETNTGTKAGKGKGCPDFTETLAVGGAPTGSLDQGVLPQGEYDASMSSTGSTPKSLAPVGVGFWLGPMTASGTKDALTITGMTSATAPLATAKEGWDGDAPSAPVDCEAIDGSLTSKGADGLESFSGLHPVAVTKSGDPIFSGTWRLRTNPNDIGLKAGCSLTRWEGRLLLVPHGAGL